MDEALDAFNGLVDQMIDNSSVPADQRGNLRDSISTLEDDIEAAVVDSYYANGPDFSGDITGFVGIATGMISDMEQFNGSNTSGSININDFEVHPKSTQIVNKLVATFKQNSFLKDPLSEIGLLGVKIIVLRGLESSFYGKRSDTIFLSLQDIQKYGVAVLTHDLLHAGLEKARISQVINLHQYNFLSGLNNRFYRNLNGYVGNSQGLYQRGGYGHQEAFVIGWSYMKINSRAAFVRDSSNNFLSKAFRYRNDILNNALLTTLADGSKIYMIHDGPLNQQHVMNLFLKPFMNISGQLRSTITSVQNKSRNALPNLCAAGTQKIIQRRSCASDIGTQYKVQVCGDNYRPISVYFTACGSNPESDGSY